jgi:hypothetical protein
VVNGLLAAAENILKLPITRISTSAKQLLNKNLIQHATIAKR